MRLDAYAEQFARAGIAALVFDYRHFGASEGEPRQLLSIRKQHEDYEAAIAYVRALDGVDPDRVAVFGSSFSGGHVLCVASRDPRVAAVIAQCPYADGLATLPKLGLANVLRGSDGSSRCRSRDDRAKAALRRRDGPALIVRRPHHAGFQERHRSDAAG